MARALLSPLNINIQQSTLEIRTMKSVLFTWPLCSSRDWPRGTSRSAPGSPGSSAQSRPWRMSLQGCGVWNISNVKLETVTTLLCAGTGEQLSAVPVQSCAPLSVFPP